VLEKGGGFAIGHMGILWIILVHIH